MTLMPWTNDTATTPSRRSPPRGSWSIRSERINGGRGNPSRLGRQTREASTSTGFTFPWSKPRRETEAEPRNVSEYIALPGIVPAADDHPPGTAGRLLAGWSDCRGCGLLLNGCRSRECDVASATYRNRDSCRYNVPS
jgi:hypothetical protein